ncbi:hypothetical protein ACSHWG_00770 [Leucobacter sp. Z1108]|uniref:hypothetical protein n=1 Tax=Leucobacter sp. Z1108 TaxID=3439066 RepID=UPI003F327CF1
MTLGPLYHWSPRDRLKSITRQGLMPGKRNISGATLHGGDIEGEFLQPGVCFSLDPVTAWAYSHGVWKSVGAFDLWQVWLEPADEVHVLPMWGNRIVEVRVHNRIPKRRLHHVGERTVA